MIALESLGNVITPTMANAVATTIAFRKSREFGERRFVITPLLSVGRQLGSRILDSTRKGESFRYQNCETCTDAFWFFEQTS